MDRQRCQPTEAELAQPGLQLALRQPPSDAPDFLIELHRFASDVDRRWLDAAELRTCHHLGGGAARRHARCLQDWIGQLSDQIPRFDDTFDGPLANVDLEQWAVKTDILRAAALVCHPASCSPEAFESPHVPPLYLLRLRPESGWRDLAAALDDALSGAIKKSREVLRGNPFLKRGNDLARDLKALEDRNQAGHLRHF